MKKQTVIGLTTPIFIKGKKIKARVDTGAQRSSLDKKIAQDLKLGLIIKKVRVRSSNGSEMRPVVKIPVEVAKRKFLATFTLADRKTMKYGALIGRNILKKGFLIDTTKQ